MKRRIERALFDVQAAPGDIPDEAPDRIPVHGAVENGRRFSNIVETIYWPQYEAILFFKSRSRGLSLHGSDGGIVERTETAQIFP
jgi:hypothetical protein